MLRRREVLQKRKVSRVDERDIVLSESEKARLLYEPGIPAVILLSAEEMNSMVIKVKQEISQFLNVTELE